MQDTNPRQFGTEASFPAVCERIPVYGAENFFNFVPEYSSIYYWSAPSLASTELAATNTEPDHVLDEWFGTIYGYGYGFGRPLGYYADGEQCLDVADGEYQNSDYGYCEVLSF